MRTTSLLSSVELHVILNIDHRAIRAGDDSLTGRAGEPIHHRAAHEQAEDDFRLHDAQRFDDGLEYHRWREQICRDRFGDFSGLHFIHSLQQHDDAEHHRGGADDGGADEHRLGGGFEGVAGAVVFFEQVFGVLEVRLETEVFFNFRRDVRLCLDAA